MNFMNLFDINRALIGMEELSNTGRTKKTPFFYRPFHFVVLALTLKRCGTDRFEMTGGDNQFTRYAARMHLWDAIGLEPPLRIPELDPTGRFHPLTAIDNPDKADTVSAELAHLFGHDGNQSVKSIDQTVAELVGNCYAHSAIEDGLRGFVCAQRWPKANKAQIAIGDSGIGVRQSLAASHEYMDVLQQMNSCELASTYEVTSKRGKGHSGYGLTLARDLIQNNGGAFFLLSNDEYYISKAGRQESGNLGAPIHGTVVVLEWNTQIPLSAKEVYDGWPSLEGDDYDDDFNF